MKHLNPYLALPGTCEAAMKFYQECLGGELTMQTFAQSGQEVPEGYEDKIMHSELKVEGIQIMASDTMPSHTIIQGDNITLSIQLTDVQEQEAIFNKLAAGGKVTMPLQDTFWGARFGMLADKFNINWMLNCPTQ